MALIAALNRISHNVWIELILLFKLLPEVSFPAISKISKVPVIILSIIFCET
ncbi:hypothetical protein BFJ70_g16626 [Fusarium oxysporum]|nr:hypothetical protein BFJ70_g16626 [Fusarium oxysporum]